MLVATYRKHFIKLSHIYFADSNGLSDLNKRVPGDIVFLHGAHQKPSGGVLYTTQSTLIKDLSLNEEDLFLTLGKHLRQYIKRSMKEEVVNLQFFHSEELLKNPEILKHCKTLYEKMFSDKGMDSKFNTRLAKQFCKQNALLVGIAFISGTPVGFSAAICNGTNARLWVAAFDFRNEEADRQVLSRAHQQLDWKLLLECKLLGIQQFDFGGVNSFDEPDGIAQFKLNFEREGKVTYENYLIPQNLLGKLALKIIYRK